MHSTLAKFRFVSLTPGLILAALLNVFAQDVTVTNPDVLALETVAPGRSLNMKVTWVDTRGVRHKTKGWLMLVMDDAILVSTESVTRRTKQQKIYARNIIRLKYRESGVPNAIPDIAASAVEGAVSGGFVPLQTGNIGLDLLSGAVQGVIGGLFSATSTSRTVNLARRPDYYRNYVYPDLVSR